MEKLIAAEHLSFHYTDEEGKPASPEILKDLTLTLEAGSFVAVLGHNGCGKSTLAKHMNAILLPTGGKMWIAGIDTCDEEKLNEIRQHVGMVFQNPDNQWQRSSKKMWLSDRKIWGYRRKPYGNGWTML